VTVVFTYMGVPVPGLEAGRHRFELVEGANLKAFVEALAQEHPALSKQYLKKCTILVNEAKAEMNRGLQDGDHILLLTVLGGG